MQGPASRSTLSGRPASDLGDGPQPANNGHFRSQLRPDGVGFLKTRGSVESTADIGQKRDGETRSNQTWDSKEPRMLYADCSERTASNRRTPRSGGYSVGRFSVSVYLDEFRFCRALLA